MNDPIEEWLKSIFELEKFENRGIGTTKIEQLIALVRIYREANKINFNDDVLKYGPHAISGWCNIAYAAEQKALEIIK